ncbi:MAG: SDR family oxidoreductase [Campylobacter sp.]|uniref:SDR family NAD(P)-dependent oxidoreductase n=1 Tax=Campylobacter sp. TaxID=205 RepID=UPI001B2495D9|nr:SDR family oxidoreductase [Campylobacter sp.]MBO7154607.1 SDR family oxidoreductase [Campylobacter sp.]
MSRLIIITGTSRGIGLNLAKSYLDDGDIVIGCARNQSNLTHPNYHHYEIDASNESAVIDMVRDLGRKFGKIHALINNAGAASLNHIITTTASTADKLYQANFKSTFLFTKEVSKLMIRAKYGSIVNISSIAVPLSLEGEAIYASMKAAVESFTKISAKELGVFGIRVNLLGIAPTQTDLIKAVPKDKISALLAKQAIPKMSEFSDIKSAIDFFLDTKNRLITGQSLYLGGVW